MQAGPWQNKSHLKIYTPQGKKCCFSEGAFASHLLGHLLIENMREGGKLLFHRSGRSVAWYARLLGVQEVVSSNLTAPTILA